MRAHLIEAGLAETAAERGVAGARQGQGPLCPVPLQLPSLSINIYRKTERRAEGGERIKREKPGG